MNNKRTYKLSMGKKVFYTFIFLMVFSGELGGVLAKEAPAPLDEVPVKQTKVNYSEKVKELMNFLTGVSDSFVYSRVGRSDPFLPFISEQVVSADFMGAEEVLTGMRRFEPGQLALVAIVFAEDGPMAMVQDSVGKGYVVRNGTLIGRTGIVDEIAGNIVVVKQRYKSTAGDDRYKIVEMLLKREGEQY